MVRQRCVSTPYQLTTKYGKVDGYPLNNGFHTGVDYVTDDRKILAPQDGVVTANGYDEINGFYLVIEGGGYRDWFSHIARYRVSNGRRVSRGQHIADMGMTGYADGVHVHHSVRLHGNRVDPEKHITVEGEDMFNGKTAREWFSVALSYDKRIKNYQKNYMQKSTHDKIVASKDKEIESLRAQVGESNKWQTLKALLRELLGVK